MKLTPEIQRLLNEQIRNEMASSHAYLAISAWFENTPYGGFAQWMYVQSLEETEARDEVFPVPRRPGRRDRTSCHR